MLSGSKGFAIPSIILGTCICCMLKPQFSKTFTNENIFYCRGIPKNRYYKLFLVSVQKVHCSVFVKPHLKGKEFVAVIQWESLNGKFVFKCSVSCSHQWGRMNIHPSIYLYS